MENKTVGKVTGPGGVFFAAADPEKLKAWYADHLGIRSGFQGADAEDHAKKIFVSWDVLPAADQSLKDATKSFGYRYRVDALAPLLEKLAASDIHLLAAPAEDKSGKVARLLDPEGNLVELWEPSGDVPAVAGPAGNVTGLGGLFFKTRNKEAIREWYASNLGFEMTQWGCSFFWTDPENPKVPARTEWSTFPDNTEYFLPSTKDFMLNYRVRDLVALITALKSKGVELPAEMQEFSYGKFAWIVDPEGNKMELWEPIDDGF